MDENWGPYIGIVATVVIGLVALLYGQIAHGLEFLTWIGGGVAIVAVGLLTLFIHRS